MSGLESLKEEITCFEANVAVWFKTYPEHYALIKGCELKGTYTTEEEAYSAGLALLGNVPFLIKKIEIIKNIEQLPALTLGIICAHL